jgi:hypothetical protein
MKTYRQWREEVTQKRRLAVYDFDDTLVMTPHDDVGKERWEKATGQKWKGGWWGRAESLKPPVFNYEPEALNAPVVKSFMDDKARDDTIVVVMTGRHSALEKEVKEILNKYKLEPDEEYYKGHPELRKEPGYPQGTDTWDYKSWVVKNKFAVRPGIEEIDLWDDRIDHVPKWLELSRWVRKNHPQIKRITFHNSLTGETFEF